MLNSRTCKAIEANINEFSKTEMFTFIKYLCDEVDEIYDLITCIQKAHGDDVHLDTVLRDQYYDAFLKMHLS